jgi:soluble lytic murein transglycosylase-like protein
MKAEDRYDSLIVWYSLKYGRDPRQVKRQLRTESWFNPRAKNKKTGAMGLAQFMMPTWREWHDCTPGIEAEPQPGDEWNPEKAIAAHCSYMRWLQWFLGGALSEALAGYVWGPGNVKECMGEYGSGWLAKAPKDAREYVRKCLGYAGEVI